MSRSPTPPPQQSSCAVPTDWAAAGSVPDEAEMHSQRAVDARAVDAQEHAVGDAGPAGILGGTVEAHLSKTKANTWWAELGGQGKAEK